MPLSLRDAVNGGLNVQLPGGPLGLSSEKSSDEAARRGVKMRDVKLSELQALRKYNSSHTV